MRRALRNALRIRLNRVLNYVHAHLEDEPVF